MSEKILHLVGEHAAAFEIDVLRVRGLERYGEQLQPRLLRRLRRLEVVAASAGGDDVRPRVASTLAQRADVIARQLAARKTVAAVQAQMRVALEQRLVVQ